MLFVSKKVSWCFQLPFSDGVAKCFRYILLERYGTEYRNDVCLSVSINMSATWVAVIQNSGKLLSTTLHSYQSVCTFSTQDVLEFSLRHVHGRPALLFLGTKTKHPPVHSTHSAKKPKEPSAQRGRRRCPRTSSKRTRSGKTQSDRDSCPLPLLACLSVCPPVESLASDRRGSCPVRLPSYPARLRCCLIGELMGEKGRSLGDSFALLEFGQENDEKEKILPGSVRVREERKALCEANSMRSFGTARTRSGAQLKRQDTTQDHQRKGKDDERGQRRRGKKTEKRKEL